MRIYLEKWFNIVDDDGNVTVAQCIDIEFETGFGPIFLMKRKGLDPSTFWMTLKEIKECEQSEEKVYQKISGDSGRDL